MDVYTGGDVITAGDTITSKGIQTAVSTYNSDGKMVYHSINYNTPVVTKDILADDDISDSYAISVNYLVQNSKNSCSLVTSSNNLLVTNPYTKYNTAFGAPDIEPYPYSGDINVVGPSIARGSKVSKFSYSVWMVGVFTDSFKPNRGGDGTVSITLNTCPTYGKADCFIVRQYGYSNPPVRHQWGGAENDLAYDVASDNIGNATIFLRAGSDFGITSATQSLVRMKTGYNIVRLDTNGLLTETFLVSLGATGELTDTQIALGKNGAVYILAKDEQRQQYFLAKVSSSGTAWTRYFPAAVSDDNKTIPGNRSARMGLTVDSKDCAYVTGNFSGTVDFGGASLSSTNVQVFTAKYSPTNTCLGALAMGNGLGVTVRLSPDEKALYVNGWADGSIMGTYIPNQNDVRNGIYRPGAFLVKLKLTK
jgi:hypothetical protein